MSAVNEISDGDIDVEFTSEEEDIDFDCGWNSVLFTFSEIKDDREGMIPVEDDSTITDEYDYTPYLLHKTVKMSSQRKDSKKLQNKRRLLQGGHHNNGPLQPNSNGKQRRE